jgi:hypothetical protein
MANGRGQHFRQLRHRRKRLRAASSEFWLVGCGSQSEDSHACGDAGFDARDGVLNHHAGFGGGAHGCGGVEIKSGVWFPDVDVVGAEYSTFESREESGDAEGEADFFNRRVGGDAVGNGEGVEDSLDTVDGAELGAEEGGHAGTEFGDERVVEGPTQEVFEGADDFGHFESSEELEALGLGEGESEVLGGFGDGAVAEGFAVDEDAVTVEDDELGRGQVPIVEVVGLADREPLPA